MLIKLVNLKEDAKRTHLIDATGITMDNHNGCSGIMLHTAMDRDLFIYYDNLDDENLVIDELISQFQNCRMVLTLEVPKNIRALWVLKNLKQTSKE